MTRIIFLFLIKHPGAADHLHIYIYIKKSDKHLNCIELKSATDNTEKESLFTTM